MFIYIEFTNITKGLTYQRPFWKLEVLELPSISQVATPWRHNNFVFCGNLLSNSDNIIIEIRTSRATAYTGWNYAYIPFEHDANIPYFAPT